ncbi:MAG: hypothetical protein AB7U83_21490 [Vicinamibacterales bacterium]
MTSCIRRIVVTGLLAVTMVAAPVRTDAATAVITLTRTTALTNVDDVAGRYQYDGGTVSFNGAVIGQFIRTKRVVFGATAQNAASLTITILLDGAAVPENLTLDGVHSFNNGGEVGSVSAASSTLAFLIRASFSSADGTTFTLTF